MLHHHQNSAWFTENNTFGVSTSYLLQNEKLLHVEQTPWQKIEIFQTEAFGKLMVFDGLIMLTERDNFLYHEMISHPALLCHPKPENVAIIGGGDCGTILEVLKHQSVRSATQIEIDERVTRVAERYFPELCQSNQDPRAHFLFADGIEWIAQVPENSLDILIIDSTDPVGPAEGLFNQAFYNNCIRALKPQGILSQQSESPMVHLPLIQEMHEAMRTAGFSHLNLLPFPQPSYPSGWWSITLASQENTGENIREMNFLPSNQQNKYYSQEIHRASKVLPNFVKEALKISR